MSNCRSPSWVAKTPAALSCSLKGLLEVEHRVVVGDGDLDGETGFGAVDDLSGHRWLLRGCGRRAESYRRVPQYATSIVGHTPGQDLSFRGGPDARPEGFSSTGEGAVGDGKSGQPSARVGGPPTSTPAAATRPATGQPADGKTSPYARKHPTRPEGVRPRRRLPWPEKRPPSRPVSRSSRRSGTCWPGHLQPCRSVRRDRRFAASCSRPGKSCLRRDDTPTGRFDFTPGASPWSSADRSHYSEPGELEFMKSCQANPSLRAS